jgi:hypothetical protein
MESEVFMTGGKIRERHASTRNVSLRRADFFRPLTEYRRKGFKEMVAHEKRHFRGMIDFTFSFH